MRKNAFRQSTLTRTALAIAASLLVSTVAYAQQSEGSIFGKAAAGQKVTITSVDTNTSRQLVADANGSFVQSKLPPGQYTVTSNGVAREVTVSIGTGTQVVLTEAGQMQRVLVSRRRNKIDVSSVESTTVFTAEQMQALPVARDVNAIAILAPGVVKGDADLGAGNLPAFAGASVAENGYYINGFDVTNIRNFLSYANLPFDAIGSQQVKVGGYGAEFGRSLGGVISLATKRGTNTWKGGASVIYSPDAGRAKGQNVENLDSPGEYTVHRAYDRFNDISANVFLGGPIIKDKLFFFGVVEGKRDSEHRFRGSNSNTFIDTTPNGMIKLDFTPSDKHRFEFTGITNKKEIDVTDYKNALTNQYASSHVGTGKESKLTSGGHTLIGKYTGYLTDALTLSALVGSVDDKVEKTTGFRVADQSCPVVVDDQTEIGCWTGPFPGESIRDPSAKDDKDSRRAFRIDVDYVLGDHTLRGGIDTQKFTSAAAGSSTYSGGLYWRYIPSPTGTVNGVPNTVAPGAKYARKRIITSTSGEFEVKNTALYIEDSWKITKNVLTYGGLRWESFDNKNSDGVSFVKAERLLAPRLGAAWDVNGDASMKVYGNLGRYYIPVAANTNIRATRGELFTHQFYTYTGRDPVTQAPLGTVEIGNKQVNGDGALPLPSTIADVNLKPMSQDELILGAEKLVFNGWRAGIKGTYRKVQNGMDDYCSHLGFERWAADNGHPDFDSRTMAPCAIVNPGNDVTLNVDLDNNGKLAQTTFPASYVGLEKYSRSYKALEFTLDRPWDGKWSVNASYTLAKTKGTAEGYVNSVINQEDAGVSQDFDFPSLTHGSNGYTSNDRRHVLKVFGNYALTDTLRLGINATASSGRPTSCIGFVPGTQPDFSDAEGYSTASSYYCLRSDGPDAGRTSVLGQRGTAGRTPWTNSLDVQLAYMPKISKGKLSLQMDIFNLFNTQKVVEWNETRDYSRATTVNEIDPDTGTRIIEGQLSNNYRRPTSFQQVRSVRLTARYEF
ncbi:TonB-dependent receptor [Massilia sp. TSP1-1-2]|uniref:TonB-dependent receptor n=1 Tax=Massilia sp. TSP1-1-2 TaxID=2804649 RepID=UPI003CE67102